MELFLIIIICGFIKSLISAINDAYIRSKRSTKVCTKPIPQKKAVDFEKVKNRKRKLVLNANELTKQYQLLYLKLKETDSNSPKFDEIVTKMEFISEKRDMIYEEMRELGMEV